MLFRSRGLPGRETGRTRDRGVNALRLVIWQSSVWSCSPPYRDPQRRRCKLEEAIYRVRPEEHFLRRVRPKDARRIPACSIDRIHGTI